MRYGFFVESNEKLLLELQELLVVTKDKYYYFNWEIAVVILTNERISLFWYSTQIALISIYQNLATVGHKTYYQEDYSSI